MLCYVCVCVCVDFLLLSARMHSQLVIEVESREMIHLPLWHFGLEISAKLR